MDEKTPLLLVVDDDPDILDVMCETLETEGYRLARAANGAEALERISHERPKLILLDLAMPVMDGPTFAARLRGTPNADIPIVVVTADGNPRKGGRMGAKGYLAKPFDLDELLSKVKAALGPS